MKNEMPMIYVDDRPFSNQEKTILDIWNDGSKIPKRAKLTEHTIKGFDGIIRQILKVPRKFRNVTVKFDENRFFPLKFSLEGYSYIEVPARKVHRKIRVHFKDDYEKVLELLESSIDFCDSCGNPLNVTERYKDADEWLHYGSGGGAIASIYTCPFCSHGNIRWHSDFLEEHPELATHGFKLKK